MYHNPQWDSSEVWLLLNIEIYVLNDQEICGGLEVLNKGYERQQQNWFYINSSNLQLQRKHT